MVEKKGVSVYSLPPFLPPTFVLAVSIFHLNASISTLQNSVCTSRFNEGAKSSDARDTDTLCLMRIIRSHLTCVLSSWRTKGRQGWISLGYIVLLLFVAIAPTLRNDYTSWEKGTWFTRPWRTDRHKYMSSFLQCTCQKITFFTTTALSEGGGRDWFFAQAIKNQKRCSAYNVNSFKLLWVNNLNSRNSTAICSWIK